MFKKLYKKKSIRKINIKFISQHIIIAHLSINGFIINKKKSNIIIKK